MNKLKYIFFLLLITKCFSQAPRGFYGVLGVTQTDLASKDLATSPALGYKAGINFQMGYHETYNFQLEILANMKYVNVKTVEGDYTKISDTKFTSQSLDVGFYTNYYILRPDQDKFYFGPQLGVDVSIVGSLVPANEDSNDKKYLPYLLDNATFDGDASVYFNTGFGLTGGYNRFRFDLRYTKGLSNMLSGIETNDRDQYNQYTGPALKGTLNSISLSVSYLFIKNKRKRK